MKEKFHNCFAFLFMLSVKYIIVSHIAHKVSVYTYSKSDPHHISHSKLLIENDTRNADYHQHVMNFGWYLNVRVNRRHLPKLVMPSPIRNLIQRLTCSLTTFINSQKTPSSVNLLRLTRRRDICNFN